MTDLHNPLFVHIPPNPTQLLLLPIIYPPSSSPTAPDENTHQVDYYSSLVIYKT